MADVIQLLPDSVANQIAAGEGVQRPASVVKELMENALDAGATKVQVILKNAGKGFIQVIDDGKGMSPRDSRMAFERHATSKISCAQDLFNIRTMGFRGEALASIASVAEVELRTKREEDELGTYLFVADSELKNQENINCSRGTNMLVKNLFYTIPARRKFLKSDTTELRNITTEFLRVALTAPDIAFTLVNNGNEIYNLPASGLRQRIVNAFGKTINTKLLPVNCETGIVTINGFVCIPQHARKTYGEQYFFVNNRFMKHNFFHKAITEAYAGLISGDMIPSYFLYFTVDPSIIDVNIHPTKTEIKFENEQAIWQILSAAVKESLGKFNAVPSIDFDTEGMPDIPAFEQSRPVQPPKVHYNADFNPFKTSSASSYGGGGSYSRKSVEWEGLYSGLAKASKMNAPAEEEPLDYGEISSTVSEPETDISQPSPLYAGTPSAVEKGAQHLQFKGRFILTSVKSGLMLIDQHRAHIRVLFDRYMSQICQKQGVSQGMLFPEIIQLPASEAAVLESLSDDLAAVGFDLSPLGGGSYAINGIPSGIEGLNPVELVRNMVHTSMEKGSDVKEEVRTILALTLARAAAIVYGQVLGNDEMSNLVDSLFACSTPNYTPDGHTVLATIREEEIEKLFLK